MSLGAVARGGLFAASCGLSGVGAVTILNNPNGLSGVVQDVARFALIGGSYGSSQPNVDLSLQPLNQQMLRLSEEVARLRIQNGYQAFYASGSGSSWLSVATVGGVAVVVLYATGFSFADIMYVTKKALATAVEALEGRIDQLGNKLETVKRELAYKLGLVEEKVENTRISLEAKISAEVGDVKREINVLGDNLQGVAYMQKNVQGIVENLESQMGDLRSKMDGASSQLSTANQGIYLLCNAVKKQLGTPAESLPGFNQNSFYEDLSAYLESFSLSSKLPASPFKRLINRSNSSQGASVVGLRLLTSESNLEN